MLRRVELPLAAPKILSGLRTATVLVVGTATLVTTVGGASLGNYIFEGLEGFNDLRHDLRLRVGRALGRVAGPVGPSAGIGGRAAQSALGVGRCGRAAADRGRWFVLPRPRAARYARGSGRRGG